MCDYTNCPCFPEIHTIKEWAELPDKISVLGKWYVYSDYRTDDVISIPRFKFGDGKTLVSKLPFCTASITDYDVELWDDTVVETTDNSQWQTGYDTAMENAGKTKASLIEQYEAQIAELKSKLETLKQ